MWILSLLNYNDKNKNKNTNTDHTVHGSFVLSKGFLNITKYLTHLIQLQGQILSVLVQPVHY